MKKLFFSERTKNWLYLGLQVLIVFFAMAIGYFGHRYILQNREELGILNQARQILIDNTILEIPSDEKLQHGMVRGMLETLEDPFTYFVEPAANEVQSNQLAGSFGGIGVRLERDTASQWRLYPLPNSPALTAGIEDGDILVGVDDLTISASTDDLTLIAAVRGPVGEPVEISIQRGSEIFTYVISREDVPLPSVSWNLLPDASDIGMIKVNRVAETSADEIMKAIRDLQSQGAQAFVLDLRDNGGGLVEAGVAIANLFLEDGEIIHQQFKNKAVEIFSVKNAGDFAGVSLVLLTNNNTASSAEIIAGALKNHARAPLVGGQTYGKTTIQYIFELEDGSSIHVTSGRWWIPGVSFPLQPDYPVADDPSGVETLRKAVEVLTGD
jgi:carboxyl-terminal processing protease